MTDLPQVPLSAGWPAAGPERRFYAFAVDRLLTWGLVALAGWASYDAFWRDDRLWPGVLLVAVVAVLVWVSSAVALGATGASPGKAAAGLRAVDQRTGRPVGVGRALLRGGVLGVATIPTAGIGLATLAWTSLMDPGHRRRGWHDHLARSVVVDVRPEPVAAPESPGVQRHVVNLTALRLARTNSPGPSAGPSPPRRTPRPSGPSSRAGLPGAHQVWVLGFDSGQRVEVGGVVLIGRRPRGRPGEAVGHLVALPSHDLSLSKTHAEVGVAADGALVVVDRGSTNGSVLHRQGVSRPLSPGRPATLLRGDLVRLGDRTMEVLTREATPAPAVPRR